MDESRLLVVEAVQSMRLLVDKVATRYQLDIMLRPIRVELMDALVLRDELPSDIVWLDFGRSS